MSRRIDIVVHRFNCAPHEAELGLMRVFGMDQAAAQRFLQTLPAVAAEGADEAAAQRYADALSSIGADIELVEPAEDSAFGMPDALPPPSSPPLGGGEPQELSFDFQEGPLESYRPPEAEGSSERPWGRDDSPDIPQAPRIPHDLDRMPNRRRADSGAPEWMDKDPLSPSQRPAHQNADRPPARDGLGAPRLSSWPSGQVGLGAHSTRPPERLGASPVMVSRPPERSLSGVVLGLLAVLALAAGAYGLHAAGFFHDEFDQRRSAWAGEGIQGGEHARLPDWLGRAEHGVAGIDQPKLRALVGALIRAGSPGVWAIRISKAGDGTMNGEAILVELPGDNAKRRTVLWQVARATGGKGKLLEDPRRRFYEVRFE